MYAFKKILCLLGVFAYLIGTIGGFCYCLSIKQPITAICIAVLGVMAFPTAKDMLFYLIGKDGKRNSDKV